jgi:dolichyl-phosphate-mannose--protein O-mannosyl transferase
MNPTQALEAEIALETKVNRIWTLLSAFEESSAACISDMLLHVSNGAYIEGSLMAARFIVHVEVLFSAIDQLDVLSIKASGQCTYPRFSADSRYTISKGSQITLSKNCQLFLSTK